MTTWTAATRRISAPPTAGSLLGVFGAFAGLCAVFAAVVTAADAWRESQETSWPSASASIERCIVDDNGRSAAKRAWRINCRIRYQAGPEQIQTKLRSRSTRSSDGIGSMQEWVDHHAAGSTISIRYDTDDRKSAVLTETDMPYAGPRTPSNVKLLVSFSIACVVLLTLARALRRGRR